MQANKVHGKARIPPRSVVYTKIDFHLGRKPPVIKDCLRPEADARRRFSKAALRAAQTEMHHRRLGFCNLRAREASLPICVWKPYHDWAATGTRNGAPSRLNAFIAAIVIVRSTRSLGANCAEAAAYASSDACVSLTRVTSSAQASAARSCSENKWCTSSHTGTKLILSIDMVFLRSRLCISMQCAQPLICETRRNTRCTSSSGRFVLLVT